MVQVVKKIKPDGRSAKKVQFTSGVYKIVHKTNGKCYLGSSIQIEKRLYFHVVELRLDRHHCKSLQQTWNLYGESEFDFFLLEKCCKDQLWVREQFYIDKVPEKLLLNTKKNADGTGYKYSKEVKNKMSESAKRVGADPEERKRRSERAKRQHAEGKLGQQTWSEEVKIRMRQVAKENMLKHGAKGRAAALGDSKEMSRRSYQRKIFKNNNGTGA